MVYAQTRICHRKIRRIFIVWDFEIQTDHIIPTSRPGLAVIEKKKERKRGRTYPLMDFTIPADHKMEKRENRKTNT